MLLSFSVLAVQHFTEEPQNQQKVQGSSVTFICKVAERVGRIQWVKNGDPLGNILEYNQTLMHPYTHTFLTWYRWQKVAGLNQFYLPKHTIILA